MHSLLLLALAICAQAAPQPAPHPQTIHMPIVRRTTTPQERAANLPRVMDAIRAKYGYKPVSSKRSVTSASLLDEEGDSSYSASVDIGTPSQSFNLILDTGSSDLWVATQQCKTCSSDIPLFQTSKSSTYKNDSSVLEITYGSGSVAGYVSQDTVTFSGFTVSNQMLLSVVDTSESLLSSGLSGIMGLGFQTLSSLNATPFWQSLDNQNLLSSPVFSFYLERHVDDTSQQTTSGGTFTLGGTNTSLYSGNVEFIDMPSGSTPSYWLQEVKTVTIQGKSISIASNDTLAAIDTGTSLIGAPSDVVQQIWANVPNSVPLGGENQGMYAFPCNTTVNVSISFGGTSWAINPDDMNVGQVSGHGSTAMCGGGIFDIGSTVGDSEGLPTWIIGDTFLKNVYSVYQANPPAVGFAQLANGSNGSGTGISSGGSSGSGSSGSGSSGGSSSSSSSSSGASPSISLSMSLSLAMSLLGGFLLTF